LKRNTEPQNFSQNSPKIQKYLGIIYLLSITIMIKKRIYLDYASTTPIKGAVLKVMQKAQKNLFGNPSSIHDTGVKAKKEMKKSRSEIANILSVRGDEIIFTSGGTESNNLAIKGVIESFVEKGKQLSDLHIISSVIEHSSVLEPLRDLEKKGLSVTYLNVNEEGIISVEELRKSLSANTVLVSIHYGNNEIGVIQPVSKISKTIKEFEKENSAKEDRKILFHIDACQTPLYLSSLPVSMNADLVTFDSHKMYGPKGIGLLYVKNGTPILPVILGGGQEKGLRPSTENVPAIIGFAKAFCEAAKNRDKESKRLIQIRDYCFKKVIKELKGVIINGSVESRLPSNVNISIPDCDAEFLTIALSTHGIDTSTKSSCKEGERSSYVVDALGGPDWRAQNTLRLSFGFTTGKKDIDKAIAKIKKLSEVSRPMKTVKFRAKNEMEAESY
ncbi:MAG: hypothetical protein COV70_02610, partial [Parcubacteria group bacterium CG11_big_fil_rev_8_21_14_0_20_39_22]